MEFTSKTVTCRKAGLSQEEALRGLYETYGDVRVASIKRKGDAWVAEILQKVAEFPPPKDDGGGDEGGSDSAPDTPEDEPVGDEGPADSDPTDGPPSDEGPDGPPSDKGDDKGDGAQHQILHLLHEIAQALGVGGPADGLAPGDEPGLGGPPPGPGGDAGGPPATPPHKMPTKLKPGEVLPTQTPIGSPAFSSTQKVATQTVQSGVVNPKEMTPSQAVADLERQFTGYKVKDLYFDRESSTYRALLSIH